MKTLYTLLCALVATAGLLATAPAMAQTTVPNAGFESWALRGGTNKPANWQTTDDVFAAILGAPVATGTVSQAPVARSGVSAVQLRTATAPIVGTNPGVVLLGNAVRLTQPDLEFVGGAPYTARPASLQFYYRLSGALSDSAGVSVVLSRTVNGRREIVGQAEYTLPNLASTYTLVTVPIQYTSALAPDSVGIAFSSGNADNLTDGTTLLVDDVALVGTALATRNTALNDAVSVYPNPSADGRFTLQLPTAAAATHLRVTDALGREVVRDISAPDARRSYALDLAGQPAGFYTVSLQTAAGLVTERISIR